MTAITTPGAVASILALVAVALHPALETDLWRAERPVILAAASLLLVLALVLRAAGAGRPRRAAAWLLAGGALVVVAAAGGDGVRGHVGTLSLVPGQSRGNFAEVGPAGRSLGLRPLPFAVTLDRVQVGGGAVLAFSGRPGTVEVTAERAVGFGGFRFGAPRLTPTGGAARLVVAVSDGQATQMAEVAPGRPGRVGALTITLQEYFPDFALDEGHPFTRSAEPRNPGALLTVERAGQTWRVFVLQAVPGLHRVEELGRSFALVETEPEMAVELAVHREPLAPLLLLGVVSAAAGVALGGRTR